MNLPSHKETAMGLLALVHHSVDIARSADLRGPSSNDPEDSENCFYSLGVGEILDKIGATHKGRIGEVDNHVLGGHMINEVPKEHLT